MPIARSGPLATMTSGTLLTIVTMIVAVPLAAQRPQSPAEVQAPQTGIEDRIPRFVNRDLTAEDSRVDWIARADRPYPLREPPAPFSLTYVHRGQTYTLEDYLRRSDALGFIVLRDDQIIYERYLHGVGPMDRHLSMSVAKSVVSVLFGIAMDEGLIRSVDDPVTRYLPSLGTSGYRDATLQDVLRMATGVDFDEEYGNADSDIAALARANRTGEPSFVEYAATLPTENPPGSLFRYQSVNTQVLGLVVEEVTRMPLARYAEEKLWTKIGTQNEAFIITGERQVSTCAYSCLYASLRDYARFGLMAMRGGELGGTRVVSSDWIRASSTPAPFAEPRADGVGGCRRGYGYQWWIPCADPGVFQAIGINGQSIWVDPAHRVVIAQFSAWPQAGASPEHRGERELVFQAIAEAVAP
jgi:CubicO group peptidase (beta-lactamase class C family)